TVAWPEVTTPAYLWSRGMLMYRDIKFVHTPGLMGALAAAFSAFGENGDVLRLFALAGPLAAHGFLLAYTRSLAPGHRIAASAFFVALFYSFDGNAVWPTVLMSALSIPIAMQLARARFWTAGVLIGLAILMKQTAATVLLFAGLRLVTPREFRGAARLVIAASLPYIVVMAAFSMAGSGDHMIRWTVEVPWEMRNLMSGGAPRIFPVAMLLLAFVPAVAEAWKAPVGREREEARWLLLVAAGFTAMLYPRFQMLQAVAAVPCLALSAARFMSRRHGGLLRAATAFVSVFAVSRGAILGAGGDFDGKVTFWNEEPAFERLIQRLRALPPDARIYSELWENVLPRAGRLPPGGVYVHPWLDRFFPGEGLDARIRDAAVRERAWVVGLRGAGPDAGLGPYRVSIPLPRAASTRAPDRSKSSRSAGSARPP
ncbi:MAG: hypothetical protein M3R62_13210, partial [Acidobacteriota bacterium]|nr:hypothetical protein [Acidobacteriota bacterium]